MSRRFEKITKYANVDLDIPKRGTANSAGYDFVVAEDTIIPPYIFLTDKIRDTCFDNNRHEDYYGFVNPMSLDEMAKLTKELGAKPTLVPTGMKCYLNDDEYLELSVRSSTPLKHWLILANGVGIIDSDYTDNPDNEGHIFFQIINLSPFAIQLYKGDKIGQGIIKRYLKAENDECGTDREGGFGSTSNV